MPFYSNRLEATMHEPIIELWKDLKLWWKMSKLDWELFKKWESACWGKLELSCICGGCLVPTRYVNIRGTGGWNYTPDRVVHLLKLPAEEMVKHLDGTDKLAVLLKLQKTMHLHTESFRSNKFLLQRPALERLLCL